MNSPNDHSTTTATSTIFVKEWGRKTADKYLDGVAAALDLLQENPDLLRQEPDFSAGLYFYRVNKHVLACDYRDNRIIVLAIIHTSTDLPQRLLELEPRLSVESQLLRSKPHGLKPQE